MSKDDGKRKKESVVDLTRFLDKEIRVKFQGGREASGVLRGFDQLLNMVLDDCREYLRDPQNPSVIGDETRPLGLIVARGTAVTVVSPTDGLGEIENPFAAASEE